MLNKYRLVVRDDVITFCPKTDETLKALNCYYESPIFYANGTREDLIAAVDKYEENIKDYRSWTAQLVIVE